MTIFVTISLVSLGPAQINSFTLHAVGDKWASTLLFHVSCLFFVCRNDYDVDDWSVVNTYNGMWINYDDLEGFFLSENMHAWDVHIDQFGKHVSRQIIWDQQNNRSGNFTELVGNMSPICLYGSLNSRFHEEQKIFWRVYAMQQS
jgi:hypothetical protein